MNPQNNNQNVVVVQPPTNTLAVVGFIFSLLGFITCGIASFIGLICSIAGVKQQPNGLAIAGIILSFPGIAWFVWFFLVMGMSLANSH